MQHQARHRSRGHALDVQVHDVVGVQVRQTPRDVLGYELAPAAYFSLRQVIRKQAAAAVLHQQQAVLC